MNRQMVFGGTHKLAIAVSAVVLLFLLLIPSSAFAANDPTYAVKVDRGYLALRTAPAYDSSNEIGELYTGDVVYVIDSRSNSQYWWVDSPKYDRRGWVNKDYLTYLDDSDKGDYTVKVDKNYLALRTAPAFERSNEIGQLYTGDTVSLLEKYNGQYWRVYSPKYDKCGYVNKDYLRSGTVYYGDYRVRVDRNYLALRTAPAFERSNEIGQLYTGDIVTVKEKRAGSYWWVYSSKYGREGYVNKDYLEKC